MFKIWLHEGNVHAVAVLLSMFFVGLCLPKSVYGQQISRKERAELAERQRWLKETTFTDSAGNEWTHDSIAAHNQNIQISIDRAILANMDGARDDDSLGHRIQGGYFVVLTLEEIVTLKQGQSINRDGSVYRNLTDFMRHPNRERRARNIELLFRFSQAEDYLMACRDGKVRSAAEVWRMAIQKLR